MPAIRTTAAKCRSALLGGLLSLTIVADGQMMTEGRRNDAGNAVRHLTSKDGTRIAFDKSGTGPALILVNGALATRVDTSDLVALLAPHFTVYTYDRRGRGDSGNTRPYAVTREVEDIDALVEAAGGTACVFGKSSGASLALQATSSLGHKVTKLAVYEAPYSEEKGAAEEWKDFRTTLDRLLAADRRADALTLFLTFVGAPDDAVAKMRASEAWPRMEAMAPTLAYDNAVVGDDRSVPVDTVATIKATTLVMDGGASAGPMPFMRTTADTLAKAIPGARRRTIEGQAHDVSPQVLAPILIEFFTSRPGGRGRLANGRVWLSVRRPRVRA